MKALIIDEDINSANRIASCIAKVGLDCDIIRSGPSGLRALLSGAYCLALVDTDLRGMSGIELIRRARTCDDKTPIVILSEQSQLGDRVCGLNIGADDFLPKRFSPNELQARVNALLRRSGMELRRNRLVFRDLTLNVLEHKAFRRGRDLELTMREYEILEYLVRNANRMISISMILQDVWKCSALPSSTMVETRICCLRKKLRKGDECELIHTHRGLGYVLK